MTIARAEVFTLRFGFTPRRGPSVAWGAEHAYAVVRLEDTDGAVGWGETYLVSGAVAALEAAWPVLQGRPAGEAAALLAGVRRATEHAYATSAIAIAVDDLRARRLGVPNDLPHRPRRDTNRGPRQAGEQHETSQPAASGAAPGSAQSL